MAGNGERVGEILDTGAKILDLCADFFIGCKCFFERLKFRDNFERIIQPTFSGAFAPPSSLEQIKAVISIALSIKSATLQKSSSIKPRVVRAKNK